MFDFILNYLDKFGPELLVIQFGFLVIISTLFLWLWFSNRRKYHNLKHAIPANVVKSYLDSIIQNSTSLKSQLFRGGGLDVGGVPSVMSLNNLIGGEGIAVSGAPSTALIEELNQKKAQIAAMEAQLQTVTGSNKELDSKLGQSQSTLANLDKKIKELEALLAKNRNGAAGDDSLKAELGMLSKERDELRERLKEFEIIADDLANLKRLQQENEQLKRSLEAKGGSLPTPQPIVEEAPEPVQAEVSELFEQLGHESEAEKKPDFEPSDSPPPEEQGAEIQMGSEQLPPGPGISGGSEQPDNKPKSEKTPEDLLSEFEKMLG